MKVRINAKFHFKEMPLLVGIFRTDSYAVNIPLCVVSAAHDWPVSTDHAIIIRVDGFLSDH